MGPELLKEEQGQSQVQAGGEQGRKRSVLPAHPAPPAGPETKDTLDWFTLEPEDAWLLGSREPHLVSGTTESQEFRCSTRGHGGQDSSSDLGPHGQCFFINM